MTWQGVVRIGLELPGVEVGSAYGSPALRVRNAFEDAWVERAPKRLVAQYLATREGTT